MNTVSEDAFDISFLLLGGRFYRILWLNPPTRPAFATSEVLTLSTINSVELSVEAKRHSSGTSTSEDWHYSRPSRTNRLRDIMVQRNLPF
jgi:hypothetical protein